MIGLTALVGPSVAGTVIVERLFFPGPQRPRQPINFWHVKIPVPGVERFGGEGGLGGLIFGNEAVDDG